ncbi:helix-turn-helix transcriptional regulator [Pseudonocardia zijingensis]|uniref:helix-turn-helix domain-containing protein n=1 Tax=Pseudonocardia zijingensis TaxID=153376 RepID=UPI0031DDD3BC
MRSGSLVRRRQLARTLRELRVHAGLTIEAAAPLLDFSPSKLSRIENAHQGVDVHVVRSMLDPFDVGGDRWSEILELTREASAKGWWRAYGLDDRGYIPLEAEASTIRDFTVTYVPGLLQTTDYIRALFDASFRRRSEATRERDVTVRKIRQERLTSAERPLELLAVIEEAVLHRPVGGPAVMRAQLARLVEAAALDTVTVQVLPTDVGAHAGIDGAFTVLSFEGLGEPDMGYVEHPMGSTHVEKEEDVTQARLVFDHLRTVAYSPAESVSVIERVAAQM